MIPYLLYGGQACGFVIFSGYLPLIQKYEYFVEYAGFIQRILYKKSYLCSENVKYSEIEFNDGIY